MRKITNLGDKFASLNLSFNTKTVALIGVMAASVECAKLALSFIPNVEVVSLLLALYGYVFGWMGVVCAFVFVLTEILVWGVGSWGWYTLSPQSGQFFSLSASSTPHFIQYIRLLLSRFYPSDRVWNYFLPLHRYQVIAEV